MSVEVTESNLHLFGKRSENESRLIPSRHDKIRAQFHKCKYSAFWLTRLSVTAFDDNGVRVNQQYYKVTKRVFTEFLL